MLGGGWSGPPETDSVGRQGCESEPSEIRIDFQEYTAKMPPPVSRSTRDALEMADSLGESGRTLSADDDPHQQWFRLDSSHPAPAGWRRTSTQSRLDRSSGSANPGLAVISKVPWAVLSIGLAAFAYGGVLMIWSIVAQREELWNMGLPMLLVGQMGLLVGLILQLDRLWHENRDTAAKVDRLDHQMHEPRTSLSVEADSTVPETVSRQSEVGAGQILAELRGQLELLSERISREDRQEA